MDSASPNQAIEIVIDDNVRRAVDNAGSIVQKRTHDAFPTAMDEVVVPRFEMAVKSITG